MRIAPAIVAALVIASPAAAKPVTLSCDTRGDDSEIYGRLAVVVDLEHLSVSIRSPKVRPDLEWEYQNGRTAPVLVHGWRDPDDEWPVEQFVRLTRTSLDMGYRNANGELLHLAHIDRAALRGKRCRWHTADDFRLG
jgi:hypothetical protein